MANVLIPVDFFRLSFDAVRLGFQFARRLGAHPVLLHAYSPVYLPEEPPVYDSFDFTEADQLVETDELQTDVEKAAKIGMDQFAKKVDSWIAENKIPGLPYDKIVTQGVPEDVIRSYARTNNPLMIVMATRGKNKKEHDFLGSVTAEVIDTCRLPIFTVPENPDEIDVDEIHKIAFFCNLDSSDSESLRCLMDFFSQSALNVLLVPVPKKVDARSEESLTEFLQSSATLYPNVTFQKASIPEKDFRQNVENCIMQQKIQLLVVPNKKTNLFSRIFNPSLPHRILFERDIPMLALPV